MKIYSTLTNKLYDDTEAGRAQAKKDEKEILVCRAEKEKKKQEALEKRQALEKELEEITKREEEIRKELAKFDKPAAAEKKPEKEPTPKAETPKCGNTTCTKRKLTDKEYDEAIANAIWSILPYLF